ncbi:MAG: hypothetical protein IT318_17050, partial [Anaerolineales bacterium]|nr:hypothetical protein [Anaerolineales bacterium]
MKRIGQLLALVMITTLLITACGGGATTAAPTQAPAATSAPADTQAPAATSAPADTQAPAATTAPSGEKTEITIVLAEDPATLDPQVSEDGNGRAVNENVYETLLTRDAAGELQPLLATEYTQVDDTTW